MQFLLLISHDDRFAPTEKLIEDIGAWNEDMSRRGVLLDGRPLRPPADAVTVRVRDGEATVSDGPALAGADQPAAYELVECECLEEAIEAAATHPMAAAGAIEVRPVWTELRTSCPP
jgi:hypothetical protein